MSITNQQAMLKEYPAITELHEVIVHRLIHKIVVSEKQTVDGEKIQKVRIIYTVVGELAG